MSLQPRPLQRLAYKEMMNRWKRIGFIVITFLFLIQCFMTEGSLAVDSDDEGLALLEFRARIDSDPYGAFANWNSNDSTPCFWWGIHCVDGKVQMLDLAALSLEGTLAPELGKLSHLRSLVLYKNRFSGAIPKEFGELTKLELLDLRENDLGGTIPAEIGKMLSLKRLLLCDNKLEGSIPSGLERLNLLSELQFDENLTSMSATGIGCVNRKFGLCLWQSSLKQLSRVGSLLMPIRGALIHYLNASPLAQQKDSLAEHQDDCCQNVPVGLSDQQMGHNIQDVPSARRRLLEQSKNLPALPSASMSSNNQIISLPTNRSSGSFPAVPKEKNKHRPSPVELLPPETDTTGVEADAEQPSGSGSSSSWKFLIIIPCVVIFLVFLVFLFMYHKRAAKTIGPWKTGLSGQLQKAFVTGVPKLNRAELETACEDFSNIIDTIGGCRVYKGTLSSGVEIAVAATSTSSLKDWSKNSEKAYRRKIDKLSRINHKNYVNLIGYCEEDEPFNRMMVFEYAPNGTLFEHLHVKEMEHLDWNARMRIIMGVAYCLQYMHHDLNPPLAHPNLSSSSIYLADDYAAKVHRFWFKSWEIGCLSPALKSETLGGAESQHSSELPPFVDLEANVYSFGVLLLETISGKLPYSEGQGPIEKWADEYLMDKSKMSSMIDPTLESFKTEELEKICEVIKECIIADPRQRPTMKEIISKLGEVIHIGREQATPRLSPLWWAELEILSMEAT
ncbi:putative LRR receptor-like serine/threonine-protein kinase [Hibiscus syriacus]|uniref:LRR receptor-like serine/threonine-protein kinase n=1 Tax=Hibiscus syriacus TaxID=106335 RepID=A0A6A2ZEK6_HIBSY|nr:putative LRR receptor-like serine/threonine-protein kinase [Hibiscus syriacus]